MRSTLGGLVRRAPERRERPVHLRASLLGFSLLLGLNFVGSDAGAQCILVRERGGPEYAPHFVLHFGDANDVPRNIQCSTSLDKEEPTFDLPIYAYNLWEGADAFDLAVRTPQAPASFVPGPEIGDVEMDVVTDDLGATISLHLSGSQPLCGSAYLGSLRFTSSELPESFQVLLSDHRVSGRRAAHAAGAWRAAIADGGGARVAPHAACSTTSCGLEEPVLDLRAAHGARAGLMNLSWQNGSGNYTLLRYRTDGRYPSDPWDGELLALLPAATRDFSQQYNSPVDLWITAWSVARGPLGDLYAASNIECGSLVSVSVQIPVSATPYDWGRVKGLYR